MDKISLLSFGGYDLSDSAAVMAGKMTLHKLVVLGEGGVGKTALTIQVYIPRPDPPLAYESLLMLSVSYV